MSLTIFLAIAILGCDVLIYFLYEWAFGESERIRKRRAKSRFGIDTAKVADVVPAHEPHKKSTIPGRVLTMNRQPAPVTRNSPGRPNVYQERLAYQRVAASYGQLKRRA